MAAAQEVSTTSQPSRTVERINIIERRALVASVVFSALERVMSGPPAAPELMTHLRYTALLVLFIIKAVEILETFDDSPESRNKKLRRAVTEAIAEVGLIAAASYSPEIWQFIQDKLPQVDLTVQSVSPEVTAPVESIPVREVTPVEFNLADYSEAVKTVLLAVGVGSGLIVAKKALNASGVKFRSPIYRVRPATEPARRYHYPQQRGHF